MKKLLEKVNTLYDLKLHAFEKVTKGFLSENHIVSQNNVKYFIKQYRFDNHKRIEGIHLTKKYFYKGGVPVILPITNKHGRTFFLSNDKCFALFPFVSGKQIEGRSLTDTSVTSLGEMLGKIHLLGRDAQLPVHKKFKPWNKNDSLEALEDIKSKIYKKLYTDKFDKLALQTIQTKQHLVRSNTLTYDDLNLQSNHLIHGDYLDHNVFFDTNNEVSNVFDFEKTRYSPRTYELFRSLMYVFLSENIGGEDIRKAKLYLNSYLSIYPASKNTLLRGLKLFYLKSIHSTWIESEHYLKNNNRVDKFLSKNLQRTNYLSKNFKKLENKLFD